VTLVLVALAVWLAPFGALALWGLWLADRTVDRTCARVLLRLAAIEPCRCRGDEDTIRLPRLPLER
jgi:hypothetical protein